MKRVTICIDYDPDWVRHEDLIHYIQGLRRNLTTKLARPAIKNFDFDIEQIKD